MFFFSPTPPPVLLSAPPCSQAIDDVAENCALYASLCSKINVGASNSESPEVRNAVPAAFRNHLVGSCVSVFCDGGTKPDGDDDDKLAAAAPFDLESRVRAVVASRFLGELFLSMKNMKIYFMVSLTVQNLVRTCDDRNLECLCALLTTVGAKLKKVMYFNCRIDNRIIITARVGVVLFFLLRR